MDFLSDLCGWIYTVSWSLSFYPQPLLNYSRRSTSGTTVDFPIINVLGFYSYAASNAAFLYSSMVRAQYSSRHDGLTPAIHLNDLAFAVHGSVMTSVTLSMFLLPAWNFGPNPRVRPTWAVLGVVAGSLLAVVVASVLILAAPEIWCALDVVYVVSYVKLLCTLVKYSPQALTNYRLKSTRGWSINAVLCDFSGGVFSILQLLLDSIRQGDWSAVTGNPVKLGLATVSLTYDIIFMVQHYVLYTQPPLDPGVVETEPLLVGSVDGDAA